MAKNFFHEIFKRHMLHEGRWINKGIKWHRHFYINKQNIHGYLSESIKKKNKKK